MTRYWVFDWLLENGLRHEQDADRLLNDPELCASLLIGAKQMGRLEPPELFGRRSIVAGSGMDLTTRGICGHLDCRKDQVNNLFRHVWHYFDYIVLPDQLFYWPDPDSEYFDLEGLRDYIALIMYIAELGATNLCVFVSRGNNFCKEHWKAYAEEANLSLFFESAAELADEYLPLSKAHFERQPDGHSFATFYFPGTGVFAKRFSRIHPRTLAAKNRIVRKMLIDEIGGQLRNLSVDLHLAREADSPLGAAIEFHKRALRQRRAEEAEPAGIAFDLHLPGIQNIPIGALIELREREAGAFISFQRALEKAIEHRLETVDLTGDEVSQTLYHRELEPAIAKIRTRLTNAARAIRGNVTLGAVSTVSAVVGLLWHQITLSSLAIPAVGASVTGLNQAVNASRDVRAEDMYFLFDAMHLQQRKRSGLNH